MKQLPQHTDVHIYNLVVKKIGINSSLILNIYLKKNSIQDLKQLRLGIIFNRSEVTFQDDSLSLSVSLDLVR